MILFHLFLFLIFQRSICVSFEKKSLLLFLRFYFRHSLDWYRLGCVHTIADSFFVAPGKAIRYQSAINLLSGFYLGFILWGRRSEWPKATSVLGGSGCMPPRKFFEMHMRWDAIWCILRHNFTMLQCMHCRPRRVWMIFQIQLLIYCNDDNIFLGGKLDIFGGKLLPLKYPR